MNKNNIMDNENNTISISLFIDQVDDVYKFDMCLYLNMLGGILIDLTEKEFIIIITDILYKLYNYKGVIFYDCNNIPFLYDDLLEYRKEWTNKPCQEIVTHMIECWKEILNII